MSPRDNHLSSSHDILQLLEFTASLAPATRIQLAIIIIFVDYETRTPKVLLDNEFLEIKQFSRMNEFITAKSPEARCIFGYFSKENCNCRFSLPESSIS
ncbi:hypothetical protein TNCV_4967291 [Trichonephila clavipes]|nr:hypothetical protein TNCV_4967291 [Trichonephila clavipes]